MPIGNGLLSPQYGNLGLLGQQQQPVAPAPTAQSGGNMFSDLFGGMGSGEPNYALMALGQGIQQGNVAGAFAANAPIMAVAKSKNATKAWLMRKGMTAEDADVYASNPSLLAEALKGTSHKYTSAGNGTMFDETLGQFVHDPNSPGKHSTNYQDYLDAKTEGFKGDFTAWQTKSMRDQDPTIGNEAKVRGDYMQEPTVKKYSDVRDSYERMRSAAHTAEQYEKTGGPQGPADIALLTSYMKMVDPGTGVKEGEFLTAEKAGGVTNEVRNLYNKLLTGGKLSPEVRSSVLKSAEGLYLESARNMGDLNKRYGGIATRGNMNPENIIQPAEQYDPIQAPGATKVLSGITYTQQPDGSWTY